MSGDPTNYELGVTLARLEGKMDLAINKIDEHAKLDLIIHTDHEKRIRANEAGRYKAAGLVAAISMFVGAIAAWFGKGHV